MLDNTIEMWYCLIILKGVKEMNKKVICLSCKREVEVKLINYGDGHIATCPVCQKLAYNGE